MKNRRKRSLAHSRHLIRGALAAAILAALACGKKRDDSKTQTSRSPGAEADRSASSDERASTPGTERIRVAVDERVELFSILFRLAGSAEYQSKVESPYSRAVDAHFGAFRDHAAVVASRELRERNGISYNAPIGLAVYLQSATEPEPIRPLSPAPDSLDHRWQQVDTAGYLEKVRAFATDTGFEKFMAGQRGYFRAVESRYREALDLDAIASWYDGFFGKRPNLSAVVVAGLLTGQNNYAATAETGDGSTAFYQVVGVGAVDDKGLPRIDGSSEQLLVHEMAHGYINPLFESHSAVLEKPGRALFARVADVMKANAYGSWQNMLNETGVRATTVLCLLDLRGPAAASRSLQIDESISFLWIAGLADAYREHRGRRGAKPDPEKLVAETADYLRAWLAAHPTGLPVAPFRGPINAALGFPKDQILYVVPGKSAADKALVEYVRGIRDRFSPAAGIATADEVGKAGQHAKVLVVYGTPTDNAVTKSLLERFGWRVDGEGIQVDDRSFSGGDLVLIVCHPDPGNPKRVVVLYTAADSATLSAPNNVWHGPTDWVVARRANGGRYEIVAQGDFPKDLDGNWDRLPAREAAGEQ